MKRLQFGQSGASLVVSLIMLVVITLLALSAINSSNVNLRIAGNMQARDEARSAAQQAIEQFVSSSANFTPLPTAAAMNIDINKDGTTDYAVSIAIPRCRGWAEDRSGRIPRCSFGEKAKQAGVACNDTRWEVVATASNAATGVTQVVTQGVNILFDPKVSPSSFGC